jgi:gamma-glutamyltranspeptidase
MSAATREALQALGHTVKERQSYEGASQGDAETIAVDPGTRVRVGVADARKPDSRAVGH